MFGMSPTHDQGMMPSAPGKKVAASAAVNYLPIISAYGEVFAEIRGDPVMLATNPSLRGKRRVPRNTIYGISSSGLLANGQSVVIWGKDTSYQSSEITSTAAILDADGRFVRAGNFNLTGNGMKVRVASNGQSGILVCEGTSINNRRFSADGGLTSVACAAVPNAADPLALFWTGSQFAYAYKSDNGTLAVRGLGPEGNGPFSAVASVAANQDAGTTIRFSQNRLTGITEFITAEYAAGGAGQSALLRVLPDASLSQIATQQNLTYFTIPFCCIGEDTHVSRDGRDGGIWLYKNGLTKIADFPARLLSPDTTNNTGVLILIHATVLLDGRIVALVFPSGNAPDYADADREARSTIIGILTFQNVEDFRAHRVLAAGLGVPLPDRNANVKTTDYFTINGRL